MFYVDVFGSYFPIPRRFHLVAQRAINSGILWFSSPPFASAPHAAIPAGYVRIGSYEAWTRDLRKNQAALHKVMSKVDDGIVFEIWEVNDGGILQGRRITLLHNGREFVEVVDTEEKLAERLLAHFLSLRRQLKLAIKDAKFDVSSIDAVAWQLSGCRS